MITNTAMDIGLDFYTDEIANRFGDAIREVVLPSEQYGDVSKYDREVFNALDNVYSVAATTGVKDNINTINKERNDEIEIYVEQHKKDPTATVKIYIFIIVILIN